MLPLDALMNRARLSVPTGDPTTLKTKLLITGISRSGTSYLCNLLHRYDNCVVLNEPAEVFAVLERQGIPHDLNDVFQVMRQKILAGEPIENKLTGGEVTPDTAVHGGGRSLYQPRPATAEFALAMKNTHAFLPRLEGVREAMRDARIVACVRNPIDTIASWKYRRFAHLREADVVKIPIGHVEDRWLSDSDRGSLREIGNTTDAALRRALLWRHFAGMILRNREHVLLVRYQDFVREPALALARILEGYQPGQLVRPLTQSEPRRTGEALDQQEKDVIRSVCQDAARALGVMEDD